MIEILQSDPVLSVLIQFPMVFIMGTIMLGMRQDLRDLRGDLRECIKEQAALLREVINGKN